MLKKFFPVLIWLPILTLGLNSCSDDKSDEPGAETPEEVKTNCHYDLWIALDQHAGIGRDVQTLVRSVDSLSAGQPPIDFVGEGTEVHSLLTIESIIQGPYYYQVPVSGDRFSKYTIKDNHIEVVKERPFQSNVFTPRKYTHAWLDDNTLLIMSANGDATQVIWTKLDTQQMTIIDEGILGLDLPFDAKVFTTSGILSYRKSDNKLFYFYFGKSSANRYGISTSPFIIATIDASTMKVVSNEINACEVSEMAGSAYGELLQNCTLVDDDGYLYLAAFTEFEDDSEKSSLLRIKPGTNNVDTSYNGFQNDGKLLSLQYLGDNKALAYARDDQEGKNVNDYSHYYCIIDLKTCQSTRLKYNGVDLPYSSGRFTNLMASVDGKVYVGINPKDSNPCIYVYDIATGQTVKGADLAEGYYFEQIRVITNPE